MCRIGLMTGFFVPVLSMGCERMAEHVEPKPAPVPLTLADLAGDWRAMCSLDLLLGEAEGRDVYVQMRIVIPSDGRADSGAIVGTTRFEGDGCDGESSYDARPVSYALRSTALNGDVYVLESTLEDHGSEDPFSATRFIALTVNTDADLMMIDIDGEAGRAPLTEMPADPQSAWGWFADDPESRGVMAVWQGEGPG